MKNPTRLSRTVTRRLGGRIPALGGRRPAPTTLTADGLTNAAWAELTARTLEEAVVLRKAGSAAA
jgi:hypothetical protein